MPTAMTTELDITWTRRADPDPAVGVGEAFDANGLYKYTWLRVGPVIIKLHERNRSRRTLQDLHDTLSEALIKTKAGENGTSQTFGEDGNTINRAPMPTVQRPNPRRVNAGKRSAIGRR